MDYDYHTFTLPTGQTPPAGYGDWLEVAETSTSRAGVAIALCEWVCGHVSRDVMIKPNWHGTIHIRGMAVDEVERLLQSVANVDVLDMKQSLTEAHNT